MCFIIVSSLGLARASVNCSSMDELPSLFYQRDVEAEEGKEGIDSKGDFFQYKLDEFYRKGVIE